MTSCFIFDISESSSRTSAKFQIHKGKGRTSNSLCPFLLLVPLSEGGLFSENAERNNNYLLEGCRQALSYQTWFIIQRRMICPPVDLYWLPYRRLTGGGLFWELSLSHVAPNNSKLFRVFSWVRWLEMKMPQLSARTGSKINTNCHHWRGVGGINLALCVNRRIRFQRTCQYRPLCNAGVFSDPFPGRRGGSPLVLFAMEHIT